MPRYGIFGETLKKFREKAGFKTLTQAYSATYISESSLSRYERDEVIPNASDIMNMAEKYNAPHLLSMYCKSCCKIGFYHHITPDEELIDNPYKLVLRLFDNIENVNKQLPKLRKMLLDGDIGRNPLVLEETKLIFKSMEHDIKAFETLTEKECPNKQVVKLHEQKRNLRV